MLQNKKWVPYESATPNFERKKNIGDTECARRITHFQKKVGVSKQKLDSLLAYSSKYQKISLGKFLPIDLSSLFKPQQLNPKKLGGKHGQKPQHNPKGNCTAEWSQFLSCSKKKKKIRRLPLLDHACKYFLIFSTYSSFCR